jgi:hypothetical protein
MDGKAFVCTVILEKENFNTSTQLFEEVGCSD